MIQLINADRPGLTFTTLYIGPDLSKYINSSRLSTFSIAEACRFWKQIASGLAYHGKNIVHLDIKLQNILFGVSGAKICDFGIAERITDKEPIEYPGGTIPYLPPAFLTKQMGSFPADIWALGVTLLFLLRIIPLPTLPISFNSLGKESAANEQLRRWQTRLTDHAAGVDRIITPALTRKDWQALPLPTTTQC